MRKTLGLPPIVVIPEVALFTFSVLTIRAAIIASQPLVGLGEDSEFSKQIWDFRKSVLTAWNFEVFQYPKDQTIAVVQKVLDYYNESLTSSSNLQTGTGYFFGIDHGLTEAWGNTLVPWQQKIVRRQIVLQDVLARLSASTAEMVSGIPNLRDEIGDGLLDLRGLVSAMEYAAANDPNPRNFLNGLADAFGALATLLNTAGQLLGAMLGLLIELGKTLKNVIKYFTDWVPILVGGAVGIGSIFLVYLGVKKARRIAEKA